MKRILVSLDELLDTRLGMISIHRPELAQEWVRPDNDVYFKRMNDNLLWVSLGWTEDDWYRRWDKREVELLHHSVVTHIPDVINEIIRLYRNSGEHGLDDIGITLDINTYPYLLHENELSELTKVIQSLIPSAETINYLKYSIKSLDIPIIKQYNFILMYQFNRWVYTHGKSLEKKLLPSVHFFIPRLMHIVPDMEEINKDTYMKQLWKLDPFKLTESLAAPKLGMTFIAASDFGPKLTRPIHPEKEIKDLDYLTDQSGLYTLDNSLYDP